MRYLSWVSVVASVLVLALAGTAFAYYMKFNGNINRVPGLAAANHKAPGTQDGAENLLVVGNDSRNGATAQQLALLNTTNDGGSLNTDTIMVLHLAPGGGPATLISFPRDSYVAIPGHGMNKINAAFAIGEAQQKGAGYALLTQTIEQLSGLHIDHFVSIGLLQFYNMSNTIGGVRVCVVNPSLTGGSILNGANQYVRVPSQDVGGAFDPYSGLSLPKGVSTIQGTQALAFVRQRHGLPEGDIDRIHRQQRFLTAIVQKAKQQRNPATVLSVLDQVTSSLTVDSGLDGLHLLSLGKRLSGLDPAQIRYITLPYSTISGTADIGGVAASVVELDKAKDAAFFANIKAERDPFAAAPDPLASATAAAPSATHVIVENGAGVNGVAGAARSKLAGYGYQVDSIATVKASGTTTIRYNSADAAMARALAKAVPGAAVTEDSSVAAGAVVLTLSKGSAEVQNPMAATDRAHGPDPVRERDDAAGHHRRELRQPDRRRALRPVTVPDLLAARTRTDGASPLLTFYDDATGDRTELSATTVANWVAKTANLLVDGLGAGRGDDVVVALPLHWQSVVVLAGCWAAGLTVRFDGAADLAVCAEGGPRPASDELLVLSLRPMGAPLSSPDPDVTDYAAEVRSYADRFAGEGPQAADEALPGRSHADLCAGPADPGRRLLAPHGDPLLDADLLLRAYVAPLLGGGSAVLCRHADPALLDRRRTLERVSDPTL